MSIRNTNSLNEELKKRESAERAQKNAQSGTEVLTLDDASRVKVLSPGRLVTKRFLRNKLAIVGLCILVFMFVFAFLGPLVYPYSQTDIFYTYKPLLIDYASAMERKDVVSYTLEGADEVHYSVTNRLNSYITEMEAEGVTDRVVDDGKGLLYQVTKQGDHVYLLSTFDRTPVATFSQNATVAVFNKLSNTFDWTGEPLDAAFEEAARANILTGDGSFEVDGVQYSYTMGGKKQFTIVCDGSKVTYVGEALGEEFEAALHAAQGSFQFNDKNYMVAVDDAGTATVSLQGDPRPAQIASTYVFNAVDTEMTFSDSFRANALTALYADGTFDADGSSWTILSNEDGEPIISDAAGNMVATMSTFVVRRYTGQDTLSIEFKEAAEQFIRSMQESNKLQDTMVFSLPEMDEQANYVVDENGQYTYVDTDIEVSRKGSGEYVLRCEQTTFLIDIYGAPSNEHVFGTDGDGMDILARMMYGGRISLMVGFVVVVMEIVLGVIMGGMAGFFGGWVDTLIMRLVDIFYCIPTYPILIIMGAFFDAIKMSPYQRLIWLMVILGILGWAGIARLVRGQILSLREQEFMVAQEATGMKASRRIARHLVPNVMPQLIVNATMSLGGVIITESTLSFLGLGVKHPLATWGTMINSVTGSSESMIKYTYIWVPVGLLICLTVIAFNFVGDGLRDAFDPKMKQ